MCVRACVVVYPCACVPTPAVNMHAKNFLDIAKMEKEREAVALREARVKFRSEAVESIPVRMSPLINCYCSYVLVLHAQLAIQHCT